MGCNPGTTEFLRAELWVRGDFCAVCAAGISGARVFHCGWRDLLIRRRGNETKYRDASRNGSAPQMHFCHRAVTGLLISCLYMSLDFSKVSSKVGTN
jgi:hypothetical protein